MTLSYCYDALNRLTSKAYTARLCPMSSPVATYSYDQSSFNGLSIANGIGRRTGMTDQAGSEAWSYDSVGRISADESDESGVTLPPPCTTPTQGSNLPSDFLYSYTDANGHNNGNVVYIERVSWTDRSQSFTYDSLNRISTAQTWGINQPAFNGDTDYMQDCWSEQFSYDAWGNLISIAPTSSSNYTGGSQESGFNFTGAISTKNQIAASGYQYDSAGNLIAAPPTGTAYTFDAENHLLSAGGQTYVYDGDGKRVEKASGSPLTANKLYWYDQGATSSTKPIDSATSSIVISAFREISSLAKKPTISWITTASTPSVTSAGSTQPTVVPRTPSIGMNPTITHSEASASSRSFPATRANSPPKNAIPNPATTTSAPASTPPPSAASCPRTAPSPISIRKTRKAGISILTHETIRCGSPMRMAEPVSSRKTAASRRWAPRARAARTQRKRMRRSTLVRSSPLRTMTKSRCLPKISATSEPQN